MFIITHSDTLIELMKELNIPKALKLICHAYVKMTNQTHAAIIK